MRTGPWGGTWAISDRSRAILNGRIRTIVSALAAGPTRFRWDLSAQPSQPQCADADDGLGQAAALGGLVLIDLDDLAGLNASDGFDVGDRLLDAASQILLRGLPDGAEMERTQGGRFLVWLPPDLREDARVAAERLRALAAEAIVLGSNGPVSRNVSAGTVAALPDEARARVVLRADVALARAKVMGGGRTEAATTMPVPNLVPSRADVTVAIASGALEYHVQPIVSLADRRHAGVEALVRWTRPNGDLVGPAGFLDTLNRIPEAGADLLPEMAEAAARPFVAAPGGGYVAFNVSGAVLDGTNRAGARWLTELVERLPPDRLVLEIVETAVIVRHEQALDCVERLRARGVRIALDDFGTGVSNLERLRRFPVDILKVDRAFATRIDQEPRARAIVEALVSLARALAIDLVAEGIETEDQAHGLSELGVTYGQGYLFGRPAPAAEWAARLVAS